MKTPEEQCEWNNYQMMYTLELDGPATSVSIKVSWGVIDKVVG